MILNKGGCRDELPHQGHVAGCPISSQCPATPPCASVVTSWGTRGGSAGHPGVVNAKAVATSWQTVSRPHPSPKLRAPSKSADPTATASKFGRDTKTQSANATEDPGTGTNPVIDEQGAASTQKATAATSNSMPLLPTPSQEAAKSTTPPALMAVPVKGFLLEQETVNELERVSQARLDLVYVFGEPSESIISYDAKIVPFSDHGFVAPEIFVGGPRDMRQRHDTPWKINASFLDSEDFTEETKHALEGVPEGGADVVFTDIRKEKLFLPSMRESHTVLIPKRSAFFPPVHAAEPHGPDPQEFGVFCPISLL
ncbi:hypothetical protein ISCGN_011688 [Ixodes scapularis]